MQIVSAFLCFELKSQNVGSKESVLWRFSLIETKTKAIINQKPTSQHGQQDWESKAKVTFLLSEGQNFCACHYAFLF